MPRSPLDHYSRFVSWAKVILPLIALALLSMLFLVSRRIDPDDAIPYADVGIEERLREPRMTNPSYSGTTPEGASVELRADTARPAGAGSAGNVSGTLTAPDGVTAAFSAAAVQMDQNGRIAQLSGGVTVETSAGYRVTGAAMDVDIRAGAITSGATVTAEGPNGTITATSMAITPDAGSDPKTYLLVFNGGVSPIYFPPKQKP